MEQGQDAHMQLALVIHFHQPVGNLDEVVEKATERCYRPFLETLDRHRDVRLTLHFSGCLLEWLEERAPDVTDRLARLVTSGRVELLTGGFYEPILAALPHEDQVGQIGMLTEHLATKFNAEPSGVWLSERVWEPDVLPALINAGVRYTVLDDTMFHSVGIPDDALTGPFVTEHGGRPLLVYPNDRNLRYLLPWKNVDKVMDYLTDERLYVYADDGEKFGEWPDTHERVYRDGWLDSFFEALAQRDDIELIRLGDHAGSATPNGRVYLPSSSYDEMMTWALPTDARLTVGRLRRRLEDADEHGALPFTRGAPWRAFLAKYPEVDHLHKRMLHVSRSVHAAGDSPEALRELYRAQCNCAYWHGSFGGVYLSFMRGALWHHLMRAESLAEAALPGPVLEEADLNADWSPEILIRAPWGAALVSPQDGGRLYEIDDWRVGANLLAVMARRREAYHVEDENPSAEESENSDDMQAAQARGELDRTKLVFDEEGRGALIDLVDGRRVSQAFDHEVQAAGLVRMWTTFDGLEIRKQVQPDGDELLTTLCVTNRRKEPFAGSYGTEAFVMPLNLGREARPDEVRTTDFGWTALQPEGEVALEVSASVPGKIAHEPIASAAATLEGMRQMHQATRLAIEWQLDLAPRASFEVELRWRVLPSERFPKKNDAGVGA
jgi:4-alpha-glucanotransferase